MLFIQCHFLLNHQFQNRISLMTDGFFLVLNMQESSMQNHFVSSNGCHFPLLCRTLLSNEMQCRFNAKHFGYISTSPVMKSEHWSFRVIYFVILTGLLLVNIDQALEDSLKSDIPAMINSLLTSGLDVPINLEGQKSWNILNVQFSWIIFYHHCCQLEAVLYSREKKQKMEFFTSSLYEVNIV